MAIESGDFETFFKYGYGITDTKSSKSQLKCFKCGKALKQNSTQTALECVSGIADHGVSFLECMTKYSDIYKSFFKTVEEEDTVQEEIVYPYDAVYVMGKAIFVNKEIVKA